MPDIEFDHVGQSISAMHLAKLSINRNRETIRTKRRHRPIDRFGFSTTEATNIKNPETIAKVLNGIIKDN